MMHNDEHELLQFYSMFRHEGLMPLITIREYTKLLLQNTFGSFSPQQEEILSIILRQTEKSITNLQHGHDYICATYQELRQRPTAAHELIHLIQAQLDPSITITVDVAPNAMIMCDSHFIALTIWHLLNADELTLYTTSLQQRQVSIVHGQDSIQFELRIEAQDMLSYKHFQRLRTLPGTSYHLADRILQRHEQELVVLQENDSLRFRFELPCTPSA